MLIWYLLIIQMVAVFVILFYLRWLLYGDVTKALKRLQKRNQENLEREKALKEELERAKREAKREVEEGRQQARNIKDQSKETAEKNSEEILIKTRKEVKRLINEAARDCQKKEAELTVGMQTKAVYLAIDIVKYVFTEENQDILHSELINDLLTEIEKITEDKMKAEGNKGEITSACKLNDGQKKKLTKILSSKLGKEVELSEKVDKDIVAGLVIKLGGFVIDGSLKNKFKRILPLLKEKVKE